jgi:hypothetical protein
MSQRLDIDPSLYPTGEKLEYFRMRQTTRSYLGRIGIGTNPAYTDKNIVDALRQHIGLQPAEEWDESFDRTLSEALEAFKGQLVIVLEAAGVPPIEPITATSVDMAFDRLGRNS